MRKAIYLIGIIFATVICANSSFAANGDDVCPSVSPPYCDGNEYTTIGYTKDSCETPIFQCKDGVEEKVCPSVAAPYCDGNGYTTIGYTEDSCKTPIFQCKDGVEEKVCPSVAAPYCDGNGSTITGYTTIGGCETPQYECKVSSSVTLSTKLKSSADEVLDIFETRLENIQITNSKKTEKIDGIIEKLINVEKITTKSNVKLLVKYLVEELSEMKTVFGGENNIEDILDLFN